MTTKPNPAQAGSPATNAPYGMNADSGWPNTQPVSPAQPSSPPETCGTCGEPKSAHTPFVRKQPDKPLGIEPNGWFCPESPYSSRIRTFAAAPVPVVARASDDNFAAEIAMRREEERLLIEWMVGEAWRRVRQEGTVKVVTFEHGGESGEDSWFEVFGEGELKDGIYAAINKAKAKRDAEVEEMERTEYARLHAKYGQ